MDHEPRLHAVLPSQFRDRPRVEAFAGAIADVVQAVEDDVAALLAATLDTATGAMLDRYGVIVGEPRGALTDDDDYRRFVKARILVNRATGTADDLVTIAALLFDVDVADVEHVDAYPLATTITVDVATPATVDVARRIARAMDDARPVAVGVTVVEAAAPAFRFDTAGFGFDDGEFARTI